MNTTAEKTISLGKPVTAPCLIPVRHKSTPRCIYSPFMVNGDCYRVTAMSFGSPHGAVLVEDVDAVNVAALGASLGTHRLFPQGASIVFVQMLDGESLKARLWQRGEGETAFTCEAACVAATAAVMLQKTLASKATVLMGGHSFQVEWDRGAGGVRLTGPGHLLEA